MLLILAREPKAQPWELAATGKYPSDQLQGRSSYPLITKLWRVTQTVEFLRRWDGHYSPPFANAFHSRGERDVHMLVLYTPQKVSKHLG